MSGKQSQFEGANQAQSASDGAGDWLMTRKPSARIVALQTTTAPWTRGRSSAFQRTGLRPSLRAMQNSQDDYPFVANFVDCDKRERRKGDLSRAMDATRTAELWERLQRADALDYGLCHPSRSLRTVLCDVVADWFEIVRGVRCPPNAHQPRYRRSIRAATSSWSGSLPSPAATRPFSTSARNHSSWSTELANRSSAT